MFINDHFLGHIDKFPREVTGIRRFKRRICQAFARTVCGYKVLLDV